VQLKYQTTFYDKTVAFMTRKIRFYCANH